MKSFLITFFIVAVVNADTSFRQTSENMREDLIIYRIQVIEKLLENSPDKEKGLTILENFVNSLRSITFLGAVPAEQLFQSIRQIYQSSLYKSDTLHKLITQQIAVFYIHFVDFSHDKGIGLGKVRQKHSEPSIRPTSIHDIGTIITNYLPSEYKDAIVFLDGIISVSHNYNIFLKTFGNDKNNFAEATIKTLNRYSHDNRQSTDFRHKLLAEISVVRLELIQNSHHPKTS